MDVDLQSLFAPSQPVLETILRGTVVYLAILALLRGILKREAGTIGIADLVTVVLIADAAQNAMAGSYEGITDGLILVLTILGWNYALDWLGYHVPWIRAMIRPSALELVRAGRMNRRNMRRELITLDELMGEIRKSGLDSIDDVAHACMEGDGTISVVPRDRKQAS